MPRNTTQTLGATNGGRGGLAGYTELCESIAQFKIDSVRRICGLSTAMVIGLGYPDRAAECSQGGADVGGQRQTEGP